MAGSSLAMTGRRGPCEPAESQSFGRLVLRVVPDKLIAEAKSKGLAAAQVGPERCCIKSGALYVYHREALARILEAAADTLTRHGLPLDPDRFVQHIATNWFEADHPNYPIIAEVFAAPV